MDNKRLKKMTYTSIFTALVFLVTYFLPIRLVIIPGYINLSDSVIILCALLIGGKSAAFAGAIGASLADMALGYTIFAPITFVVKGLEGLIVGIVAKGRSNKFRVLAASLGALFMAIGYFLAEWFILPVVDKSFGMAVAISEFPFNLLQGTINAIIAILIYTLLLKSNKNLIDL